MRIWSLHPKYLDQKGLVAAWREGLLAQAVLMGKTKGYKNHPQLNRFKNTSRPLDDLSNYLKGLYVEAKSRGYNFNGSLIRETNVSSFNRINVTEGQLMYEWNWLMQKLSNRDQNKWMQNCKVCIDSDFIPKQHRSFNVVKGDIEYWEKVK